MLRNKKTANGTNERQKKRLRLLWKGSTHQFNGVKPVFRTKPVAASAYESYYVRSIRITGSPTIHQNALCSLNAWKPLKNDKSQLFAPTCC
uniref:Ovule protein n=1 Tax=Ascaris lumbricoides TaxID=6252 RepID=A0A0M3IKT9_ASCLU